MDGHDQAFLGEWSQMLQRRIVTVRTAQQQRRVAAHRVGARRKLAHAAQLRRP
jgi:hypothetical protein